MYTFNSSLPAMSAPPYSSVVRITGAANGLGRTISLEVAKLKYNIAAWDIDEVGHVDLFCQK